MAGSETLKPEPELKVDSSFYGVSLEGTSSHKIPHADLIQAMMNAGATVAFKLDVPWSTEGGVEGLYKKTYIGLENRGGGEIGVINVQYQIESYLKPREKDAWDDVLGYYEFFMVQMFENSRQIDGEWSKPEDMLHNPEMQTREAIEKRIMDALCNTVGGKLASKIKDWYDQAQDHTKMNLRGMTGDEILERFVPPPITIVNAEDLRS